MEAVILVIHLIVAVGIIVTILLQPSEAGGFVGNAGSMSNMMSQRRSGNPLTRATTILAGIFFLTSLVLAVMASKHPVQQGILDIDTSKKPGMEKALEAIVPDVPIGDAPATNKKAAPAPEKKQEQKATDSETTEPEPPTGE